MAETKMTETEIEIEKLLRAIKKLWTELPRLMDKDWKRVEVELSSYMRQIEEQLYEHVDYYEKPTPIEELETQILELFGRYPEAQEQLAAIIAEHDRAKGKDAPRTYEATPSLSTGPRYLNTGFFTADSDDAPVDSDQPLVFADNPYRLGVNIGEFWGIDSKDNSKTPIPDDVLKPLFEQQPELVLDVVLRSSTVALSAPHQRLPLAAQGNSQILFFPIAFPTIGRHAITIDLIYCGHLLQAKRVEAFLVEQRGEAAPQSARPVQDAHIIFTRTAALDAATLQLLAGRPSQITVVVERSETYGRVGLCFYNTLAGVEKLDFEQSEITDANIPKLLESARTHLQETMKVYTGGIGGSEQQLGNQLGQLADIGSSFYCALLPGLSEIDPEQIPHHRLMASLKPGSIIQVAPLSAQLSVPWELLYERPCLSYDPERTRLCTSWRTHGPEWLDCPSHDDPAVVCPHGFWGYRYIIEQLPCLTERGDPPTAALPMYIHNDKPLKLMALLHPSLEKWDAPLRNLAADDLEIKPYKRRDDIFQALKQPMDILYIYAHGGQDPLGRPCWQVANDKLIVPKDLGAMRINFADDPPLIIMNACDSADYAPADFESFLVYFCKHGAAGVIGAQCGVTELLVDGLMKPFLAEFLKQVPAGEALYHARRSLLFNKQPDPRGLAYSLFAAADLKLAQAVIP